LKTLIVFHSYQEKLALENSAAALFTEGIVLPFGPARTQCPDCQVALQVHKTQEKTVHTLHLGRFTAHETLLACGRCPNDTIYASEQLSRLVPSGCTFGYDVLVFVGKALFVRDRRTEEIIEELQARGVRLSPSEVGYLGKKFVVYLALAHRQSAPGLKQAMQRPKGVTFFIWMAPVKEAAQCS
jgi:hypothetical protein